MGWSEFIYLATGLGLGLGINRFRPKKNAPRLEPQIPAKPQTDQHQLQLLLEQLKQTQLAYQMASEISQFKAGFLARTSHELRSPINSMIGTLQLILSDLCENPEEEREFIQQAYDSALKMVGVLDQIIHVAKTEHGSEKMNLEPIQLAQVLDEVEELTALQAANRSIRLKIHKPNPEICVQADLPRLRQVLVSLVDTAIAQMDHGHVVVSSHTVPESGYAYIWVDDQRSISAWSESWDLLQSRVEANNPPNLAHLKNQTVQLSPGMRLLMNQTLLRLMNGYLEVLTVPSQDEDFNFTRTQCSIPLAQ